MEQSRSFWNCAQDQRGRTYLNLSRPEATPQLRTGNATPLYCWMLIADYYFFFTMIFLCVESCVLVDERRRWFGISVSHLLRFFLTLLLSFVYCYSFVFLLSQVRILLCVIIVYIVLLPHLEKQGYGVFFYYFIHIFRLSALDSNLFSQIL